MRTIKQFFKTGTLFAAFLMLTISQNLHSQCGGSGATFQGTTGIFTYEGELCFNGNQVTVHLDFPSAPFPTGVIIYVSNGNGTPPGYYLTAGNAGKFTRTFNGYSVGQSFNISYFTIKNAGASPPQYQTPSFIKTLVVGCSSNSGNAMTVDAGDDVTISAGSSTALNSTVTNGSGTLTYAWSPAATLSNPSVADPVASPSVTTTYTLVVTDQNNCEATDQVTVTVNNTSSCGVQTGSGSYSTELPAGQIGPSDNSGNPIPRLFTNNLQAPFPTTDWWSSLAFPVNASSMHSHNMFPHPLSVKAAPDGLIAGYPTESAATNTYYFSFKNDLTVGLDGLNAAETKVAAFSDWTVTADWNAGEFQATFGHGLPFIYCEKNSTKEASVSFSGSNVTVFYNGGSFLGVTRNGRHYGLFAPSCSAWMQNGGEFTSFLNGQNYFSVAALPDDVPATLFEFAQHAFAFVTDTQIAWAYDENTNAVTTTFTAVTTVKEGMNDQAILALFPHQWKNTSSTLSNHSYQSVNGQMKVLVGNSFQTTLVNHGALPHLPALAGAEATWLYNQIDAHYNELTLGNGGTYWHGKALNKMAQLIPIAEQVGHETAKNQWLNALKASLEDWMTASCDNSLPTLYYDETVGTMLGFPADFAMNSRLDDHHFHYGYFIMAAATVAAYDAQWASDWGPMVELLIKDVANWDKTDTQFPFLRSMDPYMGHSWASGWAAFADGNNQESTSEAIHFAAGVLRWGTETCNSTLTDLGMYLYLTETTSAQQYWFDVDGTNFPSAFGHNYIALHWGGKSDYATWFSGEPEHIHGINFLPITGYSLHLGQHPDYVQANYDEMVANNGGAPTLWRDVIWSYLALADADTAVSEFNSNFPYNVSQTDGGDSYAHTYHWLNNLDQLGTLNTAIQCDMAHFSVFTKNGENTYVAYNPSCEAARNATFSDGTSFTVNPGELKVFQQNGMALKNTSEATFNTGQAGALEQVDAELKVFPNPVQGRLSYSFTAAASGTTRAQVFNNLGRLVLDQELEYSTGLETHEMNVENLEAGIYYLKVEDFGTVRFVLIF